MFYAAIDVFFFSTSGITGTPESKENFADAAASKSSVANRTLNGALRLLRFTRNDLAPDKLATKIIVVMQPGK